MPGTVLPIELDDGLVLRRITPDDFAALIEFNSVVHSDGDEPSAEMALSTSDLLGTHLPHPTTTPEDFTIVEDTATGVIVSSLCLIPQTWSYGDVTFPATLVELVGTLPDYRRRGLVRRQFEVVHGWCAERGILVQGITGIPWYYRQFGYEYALPIGAGRGARRAFIPKLAGEEPVRLRPANADDAGFCAALEATNRRRWLVSNVRDEQTWRYEIEGRHADSDGRVHAFIIESPEQTPIGHLAYALLPDGPAYVSTFEVVESASWLETAPTVLRHLLAAVDAREGEQRELYAALELGRDHPVYRAMPDVLTPASYEYAVCLRVGEMTAFLTQVAPVLEARLASSFAHGFSGELPINSYRSGVRIVFEGGKVASIVAERMESDVAASFPDLSFLQLLFGYRSLAEIDAWHPDCRIRTNEARVLLDALFPKQPSYIWPLW